GDRPRAARGAALRPLPLRHVPDPHRQPGGAREAHGRRAAGDGAGSDDRGLRERWFGSTGRKVPQIAVEGELNIEGALVLDDLDDDGLRTAFGEGRPGGGRPASAGRVLQALKRPEVSSVLVPDGKRELLELDLIRMTYGTYSIAACDLATGQWGVATQSKFLAVGSVVTWAEPQVGAVATQSYANPRYGPEGRAPPRGGISAEEAVQRLTSADDGREHRQLGIVDAQGRAATVTGSECHDWGGGGAGAGEGR